MAKRDPGNCLRSFHALFHVGTLGGLSDRELLEWYTSREGEAAELAFSALVERHGPLVLRVCRSLVRDEHEAQDAFQATFLVLVRRAGSLWVRDSLAPWLHEVACRVASCARSSAARRRRIERRAAESAIRPQLVGEVGTELGAILHEEIGRLPESYRAAIVLCGLEGLTQDQAARQLGWPLGTLQSRLARGRQRLRGRLARRGFALLAGPLAAVLAREAAASAVPSALVEQATRAATAPALVIGKAAGAGVVSAAAVELMEGALKMMTLIRLKKIGLFLLILGTSTVCAGVAARRPAREHELTAPREQAKVLLPAYVLEPPDTIRIEVNDTLSGRPISGERLVRPDGHVSLGFYGEVNVAGLNTMEVKDKVIRHLRKFLSEEQLGLVVPDPEHPGRARTVPAIDSSKVYVEVVAYNSKAYYVVGDVSAPGRMNVTGSDTVLDAINYAGGLLQTADRQNIRLVRPPSPGNKTGQVLRVDYPAIVYEGDPTTNYQLMPGDRLIVFRQKETEAPAPDPDVRPARRPEATLEKSAPSPAPADLQAVTRRLEHLEKKLDRLIELMGGTSSPPVSR